MTLPIFFHHEKINLDCFSENISNVSPCENISLMRWSNNVCNEGLVHCAALRGFFEGVVPLFGNGYPSEGRGSVIFLFYIGSMRVELTFGCCQNSNTVTCSLPGFSFLKGDVCVPQFKMAQSNNSELKFIGYLTEKLALKMFYFSLFNFVPERPHADPKNTVFKVKWTWVTGSRGNFSETIDNSHRSFEC